MKTTSETFPRTAEQAYPASGVTGTGNISSLFNRYLFTYRHLPGYTTAGSGIGADNQYSTTGRPSQQYGKFFLVIFVFLN